MPVEIERKFLVKKDLLPEASRKTAMKQAYLLAGPERTVRIRVAGDLAWLTIKGGMTGFTRPEYEYQIPVEDALEMMAMALYPPVEKVRHEIFADGKKWEVDFFEGANEGLVLAELELQSENEAVSLPPWIGEEVTGEIRYHNSQLSSHPFSEWK